MNGQKKQTEFRDLIYGGSKTGVVGSFSGVVDIANPTYTGGSLGKQQKPEPCWTGLYGKYDKLRRDWEVTIRWAERRVKRSPYDGHAKAKLDSDRKAYEKFKDDLYSDSRAQYKRLEESNQIKYDEKGFADPKCFPPTGKKSASFPRLKALGEWIWRDKNLSGDYAKTMLRRARKKGLVIYKDQAGYFIDLFQCCTLGILTLEDLK